MGRASLAVLVAGAAVLVSACGAVAPDVQVVVVNRSEATLTVGPGVVIPACGSVAVSPADWEAARAKAGEMTWAGEKWDAPADALVWTDEAIVAQGFGGGTVTFVVSRIAEPEMRTGVIPEEDLPACGGAPLGIEPGLPQGQVPEFEVPVVPVGS